MISDKAGIPIRALEGYRLAVSLIDTADPDCNIDWALLAAIGRIESNHARFGGNQLDSAGVAQPGIIGIPLDGSNGTARITDSDGGQLDRDNVFDRAVGPMQFIPSTWRIAGADADGDGVKNPQNIADAAAASAIYLCSGPGDLSQEGDLRAAILRYNASDFYVQTVIALASAYRLGVDALPASDLPASDLPASDLTASDLPATSSAAWTSVAAAPAQPVKAVPTSPARPSNSAPTTLPSPRKPAATPVAPPATPRPSTSVIAKPNSVTPKAPTPATPTQTPTPVTPKAPTPATSTQTPTPVTPKAPTPATSTQTPTPVTPKTPTPATPTQTPTPATPTPGTPKTPTPATPTQTSTPTPTQTPTPAPTLAPTLAPTQSPSSATSTQSPSPATSPPTPTPCVPKTAADARTDDNSGRDPANC